MLAHEDSQFRGIDFKIQTCPLKTMLYILPTYLLQHVFFAPYSRLAMKRERDANIEELKQHNYN